MSWFIELDDAVKWLCRIPSGSVDLAFTDYAYESLEKHRAKGTSTRLKENWFPIFPNARVPELMEQFFRVLKDDTHLYMMCDEATRDVLKPIGEAVGFTYWKAIIWHKLSMGLGYHYRACHELILFFEKGKRNLNSKDVDDVLSYKSIRKKYPTEKPEDIARIIIENSSNPGELVIDPFCGSGSTGAAALSCGRSFYGCDVLPNAVEEATARLRELQPASHAPINLKGQSVLFT